MDLSTVALKYIYLNFPLGCGMFDASSIPLICLRTGKNPCVTCNVPFELRCHVDLSYQQDLETWFASFSSSITMNILLRGSIHFFGVLFVFFL